MIINELDVYILKTITTNSLQGLEFAYTYGPELFGKSVQSFAKVVIEYMRAYRALPTRRVLNMRFNNDENMKGYLNKVWDELEQADYNIQDFNYDLERLKKRYSAGILTNIGNYLGEKNGKFEEPSRDIKEIALKVQGVQAVERGRSFKQKTIKRHLDQFTQEYAAKSKNKDANESILTRYSAIDFASNGLASSEMLIIGAETNAGKSFMLMNIARNMWMQGNTIDTLPDQFEKGYNVLYFSLEMPYEECFARLLASMANVPYMSILGASLTDEQRKRVGRARDFIANYPYEFDIVDFPRGLTIQEMELRFKDAELSYKPHIVAVDYLQLMNDHNRVREQDWLKLGGIAGDLHEFARAFKVVMLTPVQLTDIKRNNKGKDDEDKRVGMHRVGRSSLIMHHANLGIQIETRPNEESHVNLRYHIIKNRKGPLIKQANMKKNFANAILEDILYIPKDNISADDISERMSEIYKKKNEQ